MYSYNSINVHETLPMQFGFEFVLDYGCHRNLYMGLIYCFLSQTQPSKNFVKIYLELLRLLFLLLLLSFYTGSTKCKTIGCV